MRTPELATALHCLSSSRHPCRPFSRKIPGAAPLRLRLCLLRGDGSAPNPGVKARTSAHSGSPRGFTLLEVMVALAIMAGVILTVLGAVNYHLTIIANERDSTVLTILARAKLAELELQGVPQKAEGTLAPAHPELSWQTEQFPTDLPVLQKLVLRVWRTSDKREVVFERYLTK